jgi:hypothetical protein
MLKKLTINEGENKEKTGTERRKITVRPLGNLTLGRNVYLKNNLKFQKLPVS